MGRKKLSLKEKKHRARRKSIKDGIFVAVRNAFGVNYLSPFAIAINASSSIIALLTAVSGLLGPISQMFGSGFVGKYSRKKIVTKTVFIETLFWLPLILMAYLSYKGIIANSLPILLLLTFSIIVISVNLHAPAWFSWMGDLVDENYRGRWFSKRNLIMGFVTIVLTIAAAFFLDYFNKRGLAMSAFMIFFGLAFLGRMVSYMILKKQFEPKLISKKEKQITFTNFVLQSTKNNFGKFTIYHGLINLAASISSPLLIVYLMRFHEFSYSRFMTVALSTATFTMISAEIWGKFADRYGNYKVIAITSVFIPIIPILWILNTNIYYLIFVPSLVSGIAWGGFLLASINFVYDSNPKGRRGTMHSYFNMITGLGIFLGAGLGAILIKYVRVELIIPIILIYIISAITRAIVVIFGVGKIKEIRKTKKLKNAAHLRRVLIDDIKPTLKEEINQVISINSYMK